jgi:murein DD-endopeptidase MepM/ murein hydrolase activator NlpD
MESVRGEMNGNGVRCAPCGAPVDPLRAAFVGVRDGRVVGYCSAACRDGAYAAPALERGSDGERPRSRPWRWLVPASAAVLAGGILLGVRVSFRTAKAARSLVAVEAATATPPAAVADPRPMLGPDLPPADFFLEQEHWVHPLPGPVRRIPERPTRRFGVERDHDSPESCRQGHCGVDVGEVKGEPVLAAHDGVVERVVREPGEADRGGRYVRLLHNGGRTVTQYMHLDEVAAELRPGVHVRAGEPLGTVGESGVHSAGPHLHFTVSTRDGEVETYLDPEPLLHLWPLVTR